MTERYDVAIIGSGVSGSAVAQELCRAGLKCVLLEAGAHFDRHTYPREEIDGSCQLYWSGGIELTAASDIGLLRPKAVGGGTIVNQALADRFDASALDEWTEVSGVSLFSPEQMRPWYERAESQITTQVIPTSRWNGNARVFANGFDRNGYRWGRLRRGQSDCRYDEGNDCIECLQGCPLDSKQSTPVTTLKRALEAGLKLLPETEAERVRRLENGVEVVARSKGAELRVRADRLVLAAGAIGNTKLLLQSGFQARLPRLGRGFYTHPQDMVLALYDEPIDAHKGAFQALKSDDPNFRRKGFKLENVFAPPVALAMLIPKLGAAHQDAMLRLRHLACIEVAVRDTAEGTISVEGKKLRIHKPWNGEDRRRRENGLNAITRIFRSTGAKQILGGNLSIGLHLMGGCALGVSPQRSVVDPEFHLHGESRMYTADSSVFPSAPGLNPSLTILALSLRAADSILKEARRG